MREKQNRICVSLWAYAYEIMNDNLVSDAKFDEVCKSINPEISTGDLIMDNFFLTEFSAHTGMWIYKHPNWKGIAAIYQRLTGKIARHINNERHELPVTKTIANSNFKTHYEQMFYLASLGFRVVDNYTNLAGRFCKTSFDKDCAYITDCKSGEQKTVFYKDVFA